MARLTRPTIFTLAFWVGLAGFFYTAYHFGSLGFAQHELAEYFARPYKLALAKATGEFTGTDPEDFHKVYEMEGADLLRKFEEMNWAKIREDAILRGRADQTLHAIREGLWPNNTTPKDFDYSYSKWPGEILGQVNSLVVEREAKATDFMQDGTWTIEPAGDGTCKSKDIFVWCDGDTNLLDGNNAPKEKCGQGEDDPGACYYLRCHIKEFAADKAGLQGQYTCNEDLKLP